MQFSALSQVEGYWSGLREGSAIPLRTQVEPRGMSRALEYAFLLEHIAPGIGRIRIAGMHLSDLMGMEVRGMPMTALFVPDVRQSISQAIQDVCARPCLADIELSSAGGPGRTQLAARMFLAPLASDNGKVDRLLGCIQSRGQIGRTPRRFTDVKVSSRSIQSAAPVAEPELRQVGFAEPKTPFQSREVGRGRPPLRLVHSAD